MGFINSGKLTNEDLYVIQKFARCVTKTNNLDNASRFCHSTTVPALVSTVGSGVMSTSELSVERADCIVLAGSNIKEIYPLLARRVIRAKEKGATVIVMDPRITLTARTLADIYLQLNPGTDTALINAMMKTILDEGLEDREFIEKRTSGFEELKNYLSSLDMNELERITGVSADAVKEAARIYAKAETGCILYNAGIAQHVAGVENIRALADLAMLTGNYGRPGTGVNPLRGHINGEGFGDMGPIPVFYPGFKPINEESAKLFEGYWGVEGLPSTPGETYMDMVEKCSVLYVAGANPMISAPDTNSVRKMLEDKELLVVQDIFMTDTAELADIVLPAASWAEKDGTITEVDRRVQRIGKAIDPPGEAKPDWKIICELGDLTGMGEKFKFNRYDGIPVVITGPEEVIATAGALHCASVNIPRYIKEYLDGAFDMKLAVVGKPCDIRGIIELVKREQINLDNLFLTGLNCTGTLSPVVAKKTIAEEFGADPLDAVYEDIEDGELVIRLKDGTEKTKELKELEEKGYGRRENCRRCEIKIPTMADIACGKWGVPNNKKATFVEICSDKGAEFSNKQSELII